MQFDIKELTITLMVGAFTIVGFEAILHYFFEKHLLGIFRGRRWPKEQLLIIVMLFVFAFGLGIIVEDLSSKYVDSDDFPFKTMPTKFMRSSWIQRLGLPSEGDDRAISLLRDFSTTKPDQLAIDLASNNAFSDYQLDVKTGQKVERWITANKPCPASTDVNRPNNDEHCPSKEEVENSVKALYYYAKNTLYRQANLYDDLKGIEDRLRFVRSVSMMAFIYFVAAAGLTIVLAAWKGLTEFLLLKIDWVTKLREKIRSSKFYKNSKTTALLNKIYPFKWRWSVLAVLAIFFGVYFFSIWAYAREADAFNRRTFGYFSTMLISEKRKSKKSEDDQSNKYPGTSSALPDATPTPKE